MKPIPKSIIILIASAASALIALIGKIRLEELAEAVSTLQNDNAELKAQIASIADKSDHIALQLAACTLQDDNDELNEELKAQIASIEKAINEITAQITYSLQGKKAKNRRPIMPAAKP